MHTVSDSLRILVRLFTRDILEQMDNGFIQDSELREDMDDLEKVLRSIVRHVRHCHLAVSWHRQNGSKAYVPCNVDCG